MEVIRNPTRRPYDPFDDSAVERQVRMGLLTPDGKPDPEALTVFSRLHAGLFFDSLCDSCSSIERVEAVCRRLKETAAQTGARRALLELCTLYDDMRRPLPEPIWWIVGSDLLLPPFMEAFTARLSALADGLEVARQDEAD